MSDLTILDVEDKFSEVDNDTRFAQSIKILLKDHIATTCAVCPSIAEVKAGTKTPLEHCKTCQSCRKTPKGFITLALYAGIDILDTEVIPSELNNQPSPADETPTSQQTTSEKPQTAFKGKGKTAIIDKRYGKIIETLYREGRKPRQIAEDIGISNPSVYAYLKKKGIR